MSLMLNDMIEHVYRKIFMITNVARLKILANSISIRPQMVGDIDMVWLLRRYARDNVEEVVWWFFDNRILDVLSIDYFNIGRSINIRLLQNNLYKNIDIITAKSLYKFREYKIPYVSNIISIDNNNFDLIKMSISDSVVLPLDSYSVITCSNILINHVCKKNNYYLKYKYITGVFIRLLITKKTNYTYNKYKDFIIYFIYLFNKVKYIVLFLKYIIVNLYGKFISSWYKYYSLYYAQCNISQNQLTIVDTRPITDVNIMDRDIEGTFGYLPNMSSKFMVKHIYTSLNKYYDYLYSVESAIIYSISYIPTISCISYLFYSLFFKKFCIIGSGKIYYNSTLYISNYIRYKDLYERNIVSNSTFNYSNKKLYNNTVLLPFFSFNDTYIAQVYKYIDIFLYYYSKSTHYYGYWFFNKYPKHLLVIVQHMRKLFIILFLYMKNICNTSIIKPLRYDTVSTKQKTRYTDEMKYKLSMYQINKKKLVGSTMSNAQRKYKWNFKINKNIEMYYQKIIWDSYLKLLSASYGNIRNVLEILVYIYNNISYRYRSLYYSNKIYNKYILWKVIIMYFIRKSPILYNVYINNKLSLGSYKLFRNWMFSKFNKYIYLLRNMSSLLVRIKRLPTLNNRWPKSEPNISAKALLLFFCRNIKLDLYMQFSNNVLYNFDKANIFKYIHNKLSLYMNSKSYNIYSYFITDISNVGAKFHSKYCVGDKVNSFYLYKIYKSLISYYGSVSNILVYILNMVRKVNIILHKYKILINILLKELSREDLNNINILKYYNISIFKLKLLSKFIIKCKYILYITISITPLNVNSSFNVKYIELLYKKFYSIRHTYKSLGVIGALISRKLRLNYLYTECISKLLGYKEFILCVMSGMVSTYSIYNIFTSINMFREFSILVDMWLWKLKGYNSLCIDSFSYVISSLSSYYCYSLVGLKYVQSGIIFDRNLLNFNYESIYSLSNDDVVNNNVVYWERNNNNTPYVYLAQSEDISSYMFASLYSKSIYRWCNSFIKYQDSIVNCILHSNLSYIKLVSTISSLYKFLSYIYNFKYSMQVFISSLSFSSFKGYAFLKSRLYLRMKYIFSEMVLANILRVKYKLLYINTILRNIIKRSLLVNYISSIKCSNSSIYKNIFNFCYFSGKFSRLDIASSYLTSNKKSYKKIKSYQRLFITRYITVDYNISKNRNITSFEKNKFNTNIGISIVRRNILFLLISQFTKVDKFLSMLVHTKIYIAHFYKKSEYIKNYTFYIRNMYSTESIYSTLSTLFSINIHKYIYVMFNKLNLHNFNMDNIISLGEAHDFSYKYRSNYINRIKEGSWNYIIKYNTYKKIKTRTRKYRYKFKSLISYSWKYKLLKFIYKLYYHSGNFKLKVVLLNNYICINSSIFLNLYIRNICISDVNKHSVVSFNLYKYNYSNLSKDSNRYMYLKIKMKFIFGSLSIPIFEFKNLLFLSSSIFNIYNRLCNSFESLNEYIIIYSIFTINFITKIIVDKLCISSKKSIFYLLEDNIFKNKLLYIFNSVYYVVSLGYVLKLSKSSYFFLIYIYRLLYIYNLYISDINYKIIIFENIYNNIQKLIFTFYYYITTSSYIRNVISYCVYIYRKVKYNIKSFDDINYNYRSLLYSRLYIYIYTKRRLSYNNKFNFDIMSDIYNNSMLMKRLYKVYNMYYLIGEKRHIKYKNVSYKRNFNYMLNYIYSGSILSTTKLYQNMNYRILSRLRRWKYFLYPSLLEFRRNRYLGKYIYNNIPRQMSSEWYNFMVNSVRVGEYWYNRAVYERSYINTRSEFISIFSLFERISMPLMFEDFLFLYILYMFHRYIDKYLVLYLTSGNNINIINYLPQIFSNESYMDPPIIDPDFICKYIKTAIKKQDTLYEAISEVRVWISRSLHKFKTYSYFYRKGYRRKLVNYKVSYRAPLVRSVKIEISGRVSDRRRTIVRIYKLGWKVTTSRVEHRPLQYSSTQGQSKYGVFGIKVWVLFHHQLTRGYIK
jgi:hypothetical protein